LLLDFDSRRLQCGRGGAEIVLGERSRRRQVRPSEEVLKGA
jgi:hypothetical protein